MSAQRPKGRVALVTAHWGGEDERADVVRLLAGALSRGARVEVIHLDANATEQAESLDSIFHVTHVPLEGSDQRALAIARAAVVASSPARSTRLAASLMSLGGAAPDLDDALEAVGASTVVVAGLPIPLQSTNLADGQRLVVWPLLEDLSLLHIDELQALLDRADSIGSLHPAEHAALVALLGPNAAVQPLDIALALNRPSTEQGLFGVSWFGNYVILLRRFPATAARFERSITHELLRSVLGPIAVAEVDGARWRVHDSENTAELPVNPTRVNLWRLFAHAQFCVDLRPPSHFGREAIEAMLFGCPPIVPEGSAAHAHVEAGGGGLWYRTSGEALDLARALFDDEDLRSTLAKAGRAYAIEHHEQMDDFVSRTCAHVLG